MTENIKIQAVTVNKKDVDIEKLILGNVKALVMAPSEERQAMLEKQLAVFEYMITSRKSEDGKEILFTEDMNRLLSLAVGLESLCGAVDWWIQDLDRRSKKIKLATANDALYKGDK